MRPKDDFPLQALGEAQNQHSPRSTVSQHLDAVDSVKLQYINMTPSRQRLCQIRLMKWKCPPKFALNDDWHVASGEESQEVKTQKQRETTVIEAVYVRHSDIPPSPSLPLDAEAPNPDEVRIPLIPLNPIEDDAVSSLESQVVEKTQSISSNKLQSVDISQEKSKSGYLQAHTVEAQHFPKPPSCEKPESGVRPRGGVAGDVVAAASAAFTAIMKSEEQGSLIDTDLLIQLLNNPDKIEKLISEHGLLSAVAKQTNSSSVTVSKAQQVTLSASLPALKVDPQTAKSLEEHTTPFYTRLVPISKPNIATPSLVAETLLEVGKFNDNIGRIPISSPTVGALLAPLPVLENRTEFSCLPFTGFEPILGPSTSHENLANERSAISFTSGVNSSSGTPSVLFFSSKRDEELVKNLNSELGINTGVKQSELDVLNCKRLINEYGDFSGNKTMLGMRNCSPLVPISSSKAMSCELSRDKSIISAHLPYKALAMAPPHAKDMEYYKNLVKQHGETQPIQENMNRDVPGSGKLYYYSQGDEQVKFPAKGISYNKTVIERGERRRDNPLPEVVEFGKLQSSLGGVPELVKNLDGNDLLSKYQKPCMYFNSSKGCLKGYACPYRHVVATVSRPGGLMEAQEAKRVKLGGLIGHARMV